MIVNCDINSRSMSISNSGLKVVVVVAAVVVIVVIAVVEVVVKCIDKE